jgi:hypothetical protein
MTATLDDLAEWSRVVMTRLNQLSLGTPLLPGSLVGEIARGAFAVGEPSRGADAVHARTTPLAPPDEGNAAEPTERDPDDPGPEERPEIDDELRDETDTRMVP